MNPEQQLAEALGLLPTTQQEKLAHAFENMSVDDLAEFLGKEKTANGDMLQYFQDHPEKLKEKQERDSKKEERKARKSDEKWGGSEKKSEMEKLSSEDKLQLADAWGRELAHQHFEKLALGVPGGLGATIGGLMTKAKSYGGQALNTAKAVGQKAMANPTVRSMAKPAAMGAVGGAALGAAQKPTQGQSRMGNMARGAVGGAGAGMLTKAVLHYGGAGGAAAAAPKMLGA